MRRFWRGVTRSKPSDMIIVADAAAAPAKHVILMQVRFIRKGRNDTWLKAPRGHGKLCIV